MVLIFFVFKLCLRHHKASKPFLSPKPHSAASISQQNPPSAQRWDRNLLGWVLAPLFVFNAYVNTSYVPQPLLSCLPPSCPSPRGPTQFVHLDGVGCPKVPTEGVPQPMRLHPPQGRAERGRGVLPTPLQLPVHQQSPFPAGAARSIPARIKLPEPAHG